MVFAFIVCAGECIDSGNDSSSSTASDDSGDSGDSGDSDGSSSDSSSIDTSQYAVSYAETAATYDPADVLDNVIFDYVIEIDFTENTAGLSRDILSSTAVISIAPVRTTMPSIPTAA
jgi:hypothetical protein